MLRSLARSRLRLKTRRLGLEGRAGSKGEYEGPIASLAAVAVPVGAPPPNGHGVNQGVTGAGRTSPRL